MWFSGDLIHVDEFSPSQDNPITGWQVLGGGCGIWKPPEPLRGSTDEHPGPEEDLRLRHESSKCSMGVRARSMASRALGLIPVHETQAFSPANRNSGRRQTWSWTLPNELFLGKLLVMVHRCLACYS